MKNSELYKKMLSLLNAAPDIFSPDLPDETPETTLHALWCTVLKNPCSARHAGNGELSLMTEAQISDLRSLIKARISGTPLAFLTGRVAFMGLELIATRNVLIPRPETELLAQTVINCITDHYKSDTPLIGIDIGCGSGNLTCALLALLPKSTMYSADITSECVELTVRNVRQLRFESRAVVLQGDMFSPLATFNLEQKADFIVSNPPYIPTSKLNSDLSHLTRHEPEAAFNGGIYGFSIHHRLIRESLIYLRDGGVLSFEFGIGQEKQVQALFNRVKGYSAPLRFFNDKKGNPRVVVAVKNL